MSDVALVASALRPFCGRSIAALPDGELLTRVEFLLRASVSRIQAQRLWRDVDHLVGMDDPTPHDWWRYDPRVDYRHLWHRTEDVPS
jgi:hypothetical protein